MDVQVIQMDLECDVVVLDSSCVNVTCQGRASLGCWVGASLAYLGYAAGGWWARARLYRRG